MHPPCQNSCLIAYVPYMSYFMISWLVHSYAFFVVAIIFQSLYSTINQPRNLQEKKKHGKKSYLRFAYLMVGTTKKNVHPQKLTWNLEMMVSNRNLLFQGSIFRFHVCFGGCIPKMVIYPSSHSHGSVKMGVSVYLQ